MTDRYAKDRVMELNEFFRSVEDTMRARFREAGLVKHAGDRGGNREHILREFLRDHLPSRYGVTKGEIMTRAGSHTHSADVIIYDAVHTPVLYSEETAVLPIEGVYGIIEVKSTLSKGEFRDAAGKIDAFKRLSPRDLSVVTTRQYTTVHRPSRPFGIVLGYQLGDNSLASLAQNCSELNDQIHDVNYFTNLLVVLGNGLVRFEKVDLAKGEKHLLLDTDDFVTLVLTRDKRVAQGQAPDEIILRVVTEEVGDRTFGRFFVYLLLMLERLKLGVPDLGRYVDPSLPMLIHRES
jgi:hypothetical protein